MELSVGHDAHPESACLLTTGKRHRQRRYWEHMAAAGISLPAFQNLSSCPFQGPFYQLMRQHLLAAYLLQSGQVERCEVCAVHFSQNESLNLLPAQLEPLAPSKGVIAAWNAILTGATPMRVLYAETLAAAIQRTSDADSDWRSYLSERYGV